MATERCCRVWSVCLSSFLCLIRVTVCDAQVDEQIRVVDGGGGWVSNGMYRCISAVCQPGPVGVSSGAGLRNSSGFLSAFLLHPHLDNDADGMPDEDDPDDDNDDLADASELSGNGFDPRTVTDPLSADSDGDGAADGAEATAGTNPQDAASQLKIVELEVLHGDAVVTWTARDGYTYDLLVSHSVASLSSNGTVVSTVTATGGVGPWKETESSVTNAVVLPTQFYGVTVVP